MVRGEMTIAMTPSSRKSMVAQFFENETEDQTSPDPIEIVEEDEVQIQGNIAPHITIIVRCACGCGPKGPHTKGLHPAIFG